MDSKKEFNVCRIEELDRLIWFKTFSSLKALSILNYLGNLKSLFGIITQLRHT